MKKLRALLVIVVVALGREAKADVERVVEGRILEKLDGSPIRGATVSLLAGPVYGSPQNRVFVTQADAEGSYRFEGVEAGAYLLAVRKAGFFNPMFSQLVTVKPGISRVTVPVVKLQRQGVISGIAVDARGRPIGGLNVLLRRPLPKGINFDQLARFAEDNTWTDDLGRFRFAGLPAGKYSVAVDSEPLYMQQRPHTVTGIALQYFPGVTDIDQAQWIPLGIGEIKDVQIRVKRSPLFYISGTVSDGCQRHGCSLNLRGIGPTGQIAEIRTASTVVIEGKFVLSGIPSGKYLLTFKDEPPSSKRLEMRLEVKDAPIEGMRLSVKSGQPAK